MTAFCSSRLTVTTALLASLLLISCLATSVTADGAGVCPTTFFAALVQLTPCRTAVSPFSSMPPTDECCSAINTLGQPCLCKLINGPTIGGIDRSMATQLPSKCGINFQPCDMLP